MTRLRALWESMRATYWVVPSIMAVSAIALASGIIQLDQGVAADVLNTLSWVYAGGAEGARAVLSTIAGSMITVAGVTFSITIVALTLASQQFGPRLLRNFLRDLSNQIVLGTFVSTFVYCLLVLRTVRGNDNEQFVPHLAVTFGVVLAIVSLGVLIFFIHHISTSIQASQVIANVAHDLETAIDRLFPAAIGSGPATSADAADAVTSGVDFSPETAHAVRAAVNGYVQAIDGNRLLHLASSHDFIARVEARPGVFVRKGCVLLVVRAGTPFDASLERPLRDAFIVGDSRTPTQDVNFFIRQLVELAVRALSPGINDPATACACLDRLEQALCHLAGRTIPSPDRCDDAGVCRVVTRSVRFGELVDLAFDEIRRYGRSSVSVVVRLLEGLVAIGSCVRRDEDRVALARQADIISRATNAFVDDADRSHVEQRCRATIAALRPALSETSGTQPISAG